jgi:hypothetical protein
MWTLSKWPRPAEACVTFSVLQNRVELRFRAYNQKFNNVVKI